jgi:hypothetical protein
LEVQKRCEFCGLRFNRESGYFVGAMYIAYGIAGALLAALTFVMHAAFSMRLKPAMIAATLLFLCFVPWIARVSRTLWIYFDRTVDP